MATAAAISMKMMSTETAFPTLSQMAMCLRMRALQPTPRHLHAAAIASNIHNFDTYKFVQRLEADGFQREPAEAIMNSLGEVLAESVSNLARTSVTKTDFEKSVYMSRVDFTQLRSEIQLIEKTEFGLLRADTGRIGSEVEKLQVRMAEDLRRVQSNVRLDLSLEKGRIRDEQSAQEIRIKEADSKIDTEVSTLRAQMETIQWDLFKTLFPLFCAAGALFFSYLRLNSK